MERAEIPNGPWTVLATGLEDSVIANAAAFEASPASSEALVLYFDETKTPGQRYFYRIKGVNVAGETDYSNVLEVK